MVFHSLRFHIDRLWIDLHGLSHLLIPGLDYQNVLLPLLLVKQLNGVSPSPPITSNNRKISVNVLALVNKI